jgi:hypothetical protein
MVRDAADDLPASTLSHGVMALLGRPTRHPMRTWHSQP